MEFSQYLLLGIFGFVFSIVLVMGKILDETKKISASLLYNRRTNLQQY